MEVSQAFRYRITKDEHGKWGNDGIDSMLEDFPWLSPLVEALETCDQSDFPEPKDWSALFFVDTIVGEDPKICLEMKSSDETIWVPALQLQEGSIPTIEDINRHLDDRKQTMICTKENPFVPPLKEAERWLHPDAEEKFPDHDFSIVIYHCPNCGIDIERDES